MRSVHDVSRIIKMFWKFTNPKRFYVFAVSLFDIMLAENPIFEDSN